METNMWKTVATDSELERCHVTPVISLYLQLLEVIGLYLYFFCINMSGRLAVSLAWEKKRVLYSQEK